MFCCPVQDLCQHFSSGDNKPPNAHVRLTIPCVGWVTMNCKKMECLAELVEFSTGKVFACSIAKHKRLIGNKEG